LVDRRQAGPVVEPGRDPAHADALDVVGPALLPVPRVVSQPPSHLSKQSHQSGPIHATRDAEYTGHAFPFSPITRKAVTSWTTGRPRLAANRRHISSTSSQPTGRYTRRLPGRIANSVAAPKWRAHASPPRPSTTAPTAQAADDIGNART